MTGAMATKIPLTQDTFDKLHDMMGADETYSDVIERLIASHNKKKKARKHEGNGSQYGSSHFPNFKLRYRYRGQDGGTQTYRRFLYDILNLMQGDDPEFFERASKIKSPRGVCRLIARDKMDLYTERPRDEVDKQSWELAGGWWIGTNYSERDKTFWLKKACDIMNLEYGTDVLVSFDPAHSKKFRA